MTSTYPSLRSWLKPLLREVSEGPLPPLHALLSAPGSVLVLQSHAICDTLVLPELMPTIPH